MFDQQQFSAKIRNIVIAGLTIMLCQAYFDAQAIPLVEKSLESWAMPLRQ